MSSSHDRHPALIRILLDWTDSNEFPWAFPLPPWAPERVRRLRRLRVLARRRLRDQLIARQGWPRTFVQALVWPVIAGIKSLQSFRYYPASRDSKASFTELTARWWLQVAHNLRISDQSDQFLHLPTHRYRPAAFITCREHQALLGVARLHAHGFAHIDLKNPFAGFCAEYDLPTPVALLTGQGRSLRFSRPLPPSDLLLKPAAAEKGRGIEVLARSAGGWLGSDGRLLSEPDLPAYIVGRLGSNEEWIIQERLQNASSWSSLTAGALATVRVVTARRQPSGSPEVLLAFLRSPRSGSVVDNLSAGGLGVPLDLPTGELGLGRDWVRVHDSHDHHPDTGALLAGVILPGWPEIRALALRAHACAGNWFSIGWDIALTTRGPVLIEANLAWAMTSFTPLIDTAYIEIMESLFSPDR